MQISDVFPSKYLKADDLQGRDVPVIISSVDVENLGDQSKLVLYFRDKKKGMICNKTNAGRIAHLYGEDTDNWIGKEIVLTAEFVEFQGKTVKGLRVKFTAKAKFVVKERPKYDISTTERDEGIEEDEIPF